MAPRRLQRWSDRIRSAFKPRPDRRTEPGNAQPASDSDFHNVVRRPSTPDPWSEDESARDDDDEANGGTSWPKDIHLEPNAIIPDTLCPTCQTFFDDSALWHEVDDDYRYTREEPSHTKHCTKFMSVGQLRRSNADGCHLCLFFETAIKKRNKLSSWSYIENYAPHGIVDCAVKTARFDSSDDEVTLLRFCSYSGPEDWRSFNITLYVQSSDPSYLLRVADKELKVWQRYGKSRGRLLSVGHTKHDSTFKFIKDELQQCTQHHVACGGHSTLANLLPDRQLPRRLLHFSKDNNIVKLVDGEDLRHSPPYTTLSHRWGSSPPLQLTSETQKMLYDGISTTALPLLFRDVIDLVMRLGFQYLWIDTLCIQQDDHDDWESQATRMHLVFAFSSLNVSACSALHDDSLYSPRNPLLTTHLYVKPKWDKLPQQALRCRQSATWEPLSLYEDKHYITSEPILSREFFAVFQERLLAPRTIHFASVQVFWECREETLAELEDPTDLWRNDEAHSFQKDLARFFGKKDPTPWQVLQYWMLMVEEYSRTVTTYEEDRLFALAGIASILSDLLWKKIISPEAGRYYAGMWGYRLDIQLDWRNNRSYRPDEEDRPNAFPTEYRAPSFSWASANGERSYSILTMKSISLDRYKSLIRIPPGGINIAHAMNIYGPARAGSSLRLWCNLCRASMVPKDLKTQQTDSVHLKLYTRGADGVEVEQWHSLGGDLQPQASWDNLLLLQNQPEEATSNLFLMPLRLSHGFKKGRDANYQLWCAGPPSLSGASWSKGKVIDRDEDSEGERFFLSDPDLDFSTDAKTVSPDEYHYMTALILQAVDGQRGQYRRVGHFVIGQWSSKNVEAGKGFVNAYKESRLSTEAGEILSRPVEDDLSVYEIELI